MTNPFETEALHYLLDELDGARRGQFEQALMREPAARAALAGCRDSLAVLGRQAQDLSFFGDVVQAEVALVMEATVETPRRQLWRGVQKLRQLLVA